MMRRIRAASSKPRYYSCIIISRTLHQCRYLPHAKCLSRHSLVVMACMRVAAVAVHNAARLAVNVPQLEYPDDDDAHRERQPSAGGSAPSKAREDGQGSETDVGMGSKIKESHVLLFCEQSEGRGPGDA
jgi:hypothetical protein